MSTRALACLSLAWIACGVSAARADSVSDRLARLSSRIDALERTASRPAALAANESASLELDDSMRSQDLFRELRGEAESALAESNAELKVGDRELRELRDALSARLVVIYKTRRAGQLPALYSARDFQSGLRMASSLGRVIAVDSQLFEEYRRGLEQRAARTARSRALAAKVADADLAYENQRRIYRRNVLELTRMRGLRAQRLAVELREVAKELERQRGPLARERAAPLPAPRRGMLPRPVAGTVRARFGARLLRDFEKVPRRHGIEIAAARGAFVRAVAAGRVVFAEPLRGYGYLVILEHGGALVSASGCLEQRSVALGDRVESGRILGSVGDVGACDGPGLYFELRENGAPVDPEVWLASLASRP